MIIKTKTKVLKVGPGKGLPGEAKDLPFTKPSTGFGLFKCDGLANPNPRCRFIPPTWIRERGKKHYCPWCGRELKEIRG